MFPLANNGKIILKFNLSFTELKVLSDAVWFHMIEDGRLFHNSHMHHHLRPMGLCGMDC